MPNVVCWVLIAFKVPVVVAVTIAVEPDAWRGVSPQESFSLHDQCRLTVFVFVAVADFVNVGKKYVDVNFVRRISNLCLRNLVLAYQSEWCFWYMCHLVGLLEPRAQRKRSKVRSSAMRIKT